VAEKEGVIWIAYREALRFEALFHGILGPKDRRGFGAFVRKAALPSHCHRA
jgi:hypothetical protein